MHIPLVGLNHKTAPLEVRERVSFTKEQLPQALTLLRERVGQGAILSTCNRTEVYTAVEDPTKGAEQVRQTSYPNFTAWRPRTYPLTSTTTPTPRRSTTCSGLPAGWTR